MIDFVKRNERKLSFLAFLAGFAFDWLTVKYMELGPAGLVLGAYLLAIAMCIVVQNRILARKKKGKISVFTARFAPLLMQFLFGTLFNAAFIFYSESAELQSSWPFIFFLLAVVLANELFRSRFGALHFQLVMFFIASFLYFVFAVPILIGKIGTAPFILSGAVSLVFLAIVMFALAKLARERFVEKHLVSVFVILSIFVLMNIAYFKNIIPPIPLAMKSVGLYHSVSKVDGNYEVKYEPSANRFWKRESRVFSAYPDSTAFVFASVFAPARITVPISHEWWRYDDTAKTWVLVDKVSFPITGGRKDGYRGYSIRRDIQSGKWRVYVSDKDGKHLGRISFRVEAVEKAPALESKKI